MSSNIENLLGIITNLIKENEKLSTRIRHYRRYSENYSRGIAIKNARIETLERVNESLTREIKAISVYEDRHRQVVRDNAEYIKKLEGQIRKQETVSPDEAELKRLRKENEEFRRVWGLPINEYSKHQG